MGAADAQGKTPGIVQAAQQLVQRVKQFVEADRKKIGGMTLGASVRLGLAELREAVSPHSGNEASTPLGMYGTLTPGEVGAARHEDPQVRQMEEESNTTQQPTPGDIAHGRLERGSVYGQQPEPGQEHGSIYGEASRSDRQPTPGEIARQASEPARLQPDHSHDHDR